VRDSAPISGSTAIAARMVWRVMGGLHGQRLRPVPPAPHRE
jgi:hypothetical protein